MRPVFALSPQQKEQFQKLSDALHDEVSRYKDTQVIISVLRYVTAMFIASPSYGEEARAQLVQFVVQGLAGDVARVLEILRTQPPTTERLQ